MLYRKIKRLILGISIALLLASCGKQDVLHNLSENEANRLLVLMNNAEIQANKIKDNDGSWRITVADADVTAALRVVSKSKYQDKSDTDSFKSGMFLSREQRAFAMERALSANVERTLLVLPGVIEAKVHLNLPPVDPLLGGQLRSSNSSASVLIICDADTALAETEVRKLVSGASGIQEDAISVWINQDNSPSDEINKPANYDKTNTNSLPTTNIPSPRTWFEFAFINLQATIITSLGIIIILLTWAIRRKRRKKNTNIPIYPS